jgi:hypothetical protein
VKIMPNTFFRSFAALVAGSILAQSQSMPRDSSADWLVNPKPDKAQRPWCAGGRQDGQPRRVRKVHDSMASCASQNLDSARF